MTRVPNLPGERQARPLPPTGDASWMAEGVCRETDPELWFPAKGDNSLAARTICQTCPVRVECLDWALRHNEIGVWGGTSEIARRRILTARRRAAA